MDLDWSLTNRKKWVELVMVMVMSNLVPWVLGSDSWAKSKTEFFQ